MTSRRVFPVDAEAVALPIVAAVLARRPASMSLIDRSRGTDRAAPVGRARGLGVRAGLTLVEVLVALGVVALLVALALPALRGARRASEGVTDLSNLRSTHQQFLQWGNDHQDAFVNNGPPTPGTPYIIDLIPGDTFCVCSYSSQTRFWTYVLGRWHGRGEPTWHPRSFPPPENPMRDASFPGGAYAVSSGFHYSLDMLYDPSTRLPPLDARPAEWDRYARLVRWAEVAHPSAKGMMADMAVAPGPTGEVRATLFVDGSAGAMRWEEALVRADPWTSPFQPVLCTPGGVLGRDFVR